MNDIVNGIILDTTWRVMPGYVTSIIGIDLSKYIVLSDQGAALVSICDEYNATHLSCLKHLLNRLKFNEFSYSVGTLVNCSSQADYNEAKKTFIETYKEIKDEEQLRRLNKVGLTFSGDDIIEEDSDVLMTTSILHHSAFKMPSTSNSLDATHGHLNKMIPRNDNIWAAFHRLAFSIDMNIGKINYKICHKYFYLKHKTNLKHQTIYTPTLQNQIEFYNSASEACLYGENKIASSLFDLDISCVHRLACGAQFPELPTIELNLHKAFNNLIDDYNPIDNDEVNLNDEEAMRNKKYAVNIIRRHSGFKDRDEIMQYVHHSYCSENDSFFIM